MEAERTVMQLYACQVAALHLGKVFSCTVVGVHRAGAFVRVQDPFLEGLVRSETLPDDYDVLEEAMSLVGRRSGHRISVGDRLELVLSSVNLSRRLIDFAPPRAKPASSQRPARRGPREKARQARPTKPRRPK
jgi:ribonuclease R